MVSIYRIIYARCSSIYYKRKNPYEEVLLWISQPIILYSIMVSIVYKIVDGNHNAIIRNI